MILITGFAPFGGDTDNPSRQSARRAVELLNASSVPASFLEVPVVFKTSGPVVVTEIVRLNANNPSDPVTVVICAGLAGNRRTVSLETTAVNLQDGRIPDNAGDQPRGTPVIPPPPTPGATPAAGSAADPTDVAPAAVAMQTARTQPAGTERTSAAAAGNGQEEDEPNSNKNPNRHRAATLTSRLDLKPTYAAIKDAGIPVSMSDDAGLYVCNSLFYYTLHEVPEPVKVGFVHVPPDSKVSIEQQAEALVIAARVAAGLQ